MNEVLSQSGPNDVPIPTETNFELEGKRFTFATYNIGKTKDLPNPGLMNTGSEAAILNTYRNDPLLLSKHLNCAPIPYRWLYGENGTVYGDFSTDAGQEEFKNADLLVTDAPFDPPEWAKDLWRFARLKQPRKFSRDETLSTMRDVKIVNGKMQFTVGGGLYSDAFYSMGSEGVILDITENEREVLSQKVSTQHMTELDELRVKLQKLYPKNSTIRDVIFSKFGRVPEYGEGIYNSLLGVAGTVLTNDGNFVMIKRGKNVSIGLGISATASGAVEFDKASLEKHGFQFHVSKEMAGEANREIGLQSGTLLLGAMQARINLELGLGEDEYELIPVGFAREFVRGGSPEMLYLIKFKGSTEDLVKKIKNNPHEEKNEIDEFVYAMPAQTMQELVQTPGATSVVHHKGLVNLLLIGEYLKNHPQN